ncbi:MAG: hypothetical protein HY019_03020 [Aquabacterium sp.]|uniref:hypothetical protein n=1 Tax=Aquabacterium sp. TaxID=1872578 RepID=UPI0025BC97DB|nr:hypothetical protein [Aquabacterium sp.]MBI3380956.1 hypothetical protein [Aquabacterium sp.]
MRAYSYWVAVAAIATVYAADTQAASYHYNFEAIASGDLNGPVSGSFSVDLNQIALSQTITRADGAIQLYQKEEAELYYGEWGLIDWRLAGDMRRGGAIGAPAGATIIRTLLPNGGSTLTLDTSAVFSHGSMGTQSFILTYSSPDDALFTHPESLPPLEQFKSATGSYEYFYAASYSNPLEGRKFTFTVTTTTVPEPAVVSMALAGLLVLGAKKR